MKKDKTINLENKRFNKTDPGVPDPFDIYVGDRVRARRTVLGISQEKLGLLVGLTFQQIQKYERGINRIACSTIFKFSKILDTPVEWFFEGLEGEDFEIIDPMKRKTTINHIKNLNSINGNVMKAIQDLTAAIAKVNRHD